MTMSLPSVAQITSGPGTTTHATQHHPVHAVGHQFLAKRLDLTDEGARGPGQTGPRQPLRGLGLGVRTPQGGVLVEQSARDPVGDQGRNCRVDGVRRRPRCCHCHAHAHASAFSSSVETPVRSSPHDASNFSTPSRSSRSVTSV